MLTYYYRLLDCCGLNITAIAVFTGEEITETVQRFL